MKITKGPNWQFYAVTAFIIYWSIASESIWPVLCWIAFWIAMIPLCIWLHKRNQRGGTSKCVKTSHSIHTFKRSMGRNQNNKMHEPNDEEVEQLVYRYSVGELTETQFNYYVQTWKLDREYVNLLLQDVEQDKRVASQAQVGCVALALMLALAFVAFFIFGIS